MSRELKEIRRQSKNVFNFMQNQPVGYLITILLISLIIVGILSTFGMVQFNIYVCNTLIDSFFWLDCIYQNFWFFIILFAVMMAIAMVLKRRKSNIYIGTLETDETHLWQVRLLFITIIIIFSSLIIFHLTGLFKIHVGFSTFIITPSTLAEQVVRQMYNIIWMAFCAFAIAIIVVN